MLELFHYQFFINALLAALLASISCGIIGSYIVARRMVFISGGISHASFGGIGLGFYLGIPPVLSAAVFAMATAMGIEIISKKSEVREDSMIGILWSFGMAVGIIFFHLIHGYTAEPMSYLFGNILMVSRLDIFLMATLDIVVVAVFASMFREIIYISFDEEFAKTQSMPTGLLNCVLICLVALTIVINVRVVGIILIISLLTIPQAIAAMLSRNFRTIVCYAIGLSFLASTGGLLASHFLEIPSGACIISLAVVMFAIASLAKMAYIRAMIRKNL